MRLRLFPRPESNHPERILRGIAAHPGIGPGSRILLAGRCDDRIISGLIALGCLVTVETVADADAERLQAEIPEAECIPAAAAQHQFDPQTLEFDLIAAFPGSEPFQTNLLTAQAMNATAALLGCLKPGGVYLMLPGAAVETTDPRHSTRCCVRHLGSFVAAAQQVDTVLRCQSSRAPLSEMVSVTTPPDRRTVDAWESIARTAATGTHPDGVCCERAVSRSAA